MTEKGKGKCELASLSGVIGDKHERGLVVKGGLGGGAVSKVRGTRAMGSNFQARPTCHARTEKADQQPVNLSKVRPIKPPKRRYRRMGSPREVKRKE